MAFAKKKKSHNMKSLLEWPTVMARMSSENSKAAAMVDKNKLG